MTAAAVGPAAAQEGQGREPATVEAMTQGLHQMWARAAWLCGGLQAASAHALAAKTLAAGLGARAALQVRRDK